MAKMMIPEKKIRDPEAAGAGNGKSEVPVISFAHLAMAMPMPDLLDVQREAFDALLERDVEEGAGR